MQEFQLPGEKVHTVSEFTEVVSRAITAALPEVWVRGEVSNLRRQASGHIYFSLKDESSQLSAVLFRANAMRQTVKIHDGMQILLFGEMSVYAQRGQYQIIGRVVMEDGTGRLQQRFDALKLKLSQEGLFDPVRKKELPPMPQTVAMVTSPTGAAIEDFLSILKRRGWKGHLFILPARVQGNEAAPEIAAQINRAQQLSGIDLLVISRGGGSLEDLWAFNEEVVARAIANSTVPIISAVGHETDFTLSDFVADKRAETPSAAAELISSSYLDHTQRLESAQSHLKELMALGIERRQAKLDRWAETIRRLSPRNFIEQQNMRLDELDSRMRTITMEQLQTMRDHFRKAESDLSQQNPKHRLRLSAQRIEHLKSRLQNASLQRTLQRGFAIARDEQGKVVTRKAGLVKGQRLALDFADGETSVRVEKK